MLSGRGIRSAIDYVLRRKSLRTSKFSSAFSSAFK